MARSFNAKTSAGWQSGKKGFVKQAGDWLELKDGFVKVSGEWKSWYPLQSGWKDLSSLLQTAFEPRSLNAVGWYKGKVVLPMTGQMVLIDPVEETSQVFPLGTSTTGQLAEVPRGVIFGGSGAVGRVYLASFAEPFIRTLPKTYGEGMTGDCFVCSDYGDLSHMAYCLTSFTNSSSVNTTAEIRSFNTNNAGGTWSSVLATIAIPREVPIIIRKLPGGLNFLMLCMYYSSGSKGQPSGTIQLRLYHIQGTTKTLLLNNFPPPVTSGVGGKSPGGAQGDILGFWGLSEALMLYYNKRAYSDPTLRKLYIPSSGSSVERPFEEFSPQLPELFPPEQVNMNYMTSISQQDSKIATAAVRQFIDGGTYAYEYRLQVYFP